MKHLMFSLITLTAATAWAQAPAKPEPAKPEAVVKEAPKPEAVVKEAPKPEPTKAAASSAPKKPMPKHRRWNEDARHCLEQPTNTDVIKCAEEFL